MRKTGEWRTFPTKSEEFLTSSGAQLSNPEPSEGGGSASTKEEWVMSIVRGFKSRIEGKIQRAGFWIVVIFLLGVIAGGWGAKWYYTERASEAAKLGGVIIGGVVYDVKERAWQGGQK